MADFSKLYKALLKDEYRRYLRALLVQQAGELIFEYDAYGQGSPILHEAQSTSKSIQTLLLGAVRQAGFLTDLDQSIRPFFPEYQHLDWSDGKADISLRHLVTMRAGIDWNEAEVTYQNTRENHSNQMVDSADWLEFALSRPMRKPPGEIFLYSSAALVMLSKIITEASNKSNSEWLEEVFFRPLQITDYEVDRCPKDPEVLGDFYFTPRDLLKFGQLALQKGTWEGQKLIPAGWVDWLSEPLTKVDDSRRYGAMWWRAYPPLTVLPLVFMWGVGGQHLFLIPEYDAVVLTMGRFYEVDLAPQPFHLLNEYVIPALAKV